MSPDTGVDMEMAIYTAIFFGAIAQDLLWKKVKNSYVISSLISALLFECLRLGFVAGISLMQNLIYALLIGVGLYLIKALGAGDIKIFAAASLLLPFENIPMIYIYSLIWGALFGVIRYALSGELLTMVHNLIFISNSATRKSVNMQAIPFTVAFLLGALTNWTLNRHGLSFL